MIYVEVNNVLYPAKVEGEMYDRKWDNRESKSITLGMSYPEALDTFKNNTKWFIINQPDSYKDDEGETIIPEPIVRDNSEFCIAGPITDHRNGTVTVKMGKPTQVENQQITIDSLQNQLTHTITEEELEAAYVEGVNSL